MGLMARYCATGNVAVVVLTLLMVMQALPAEDQRGLRKEMIGSVALNRSYYASHASASCAAAVAYTWALWHNLCHGKSSRGRPDLAHCNAGAPCARAVGLQCLRKEMIRSVALN